MKRILWIIAITIMVVSVACKDVVNNRNNDKTPEKEVPAPNPSNPPTVVELKDADVLKVFEIEKEKITASSAAKKIANETVPSTSEIIFTERKIISYNDKTGEFKIKFKGTKKDGSIFENIITFKGFTHPLKSKTIQSLNELELNFDDAMENNYSLEKFIEELNKSIEAKTILTKLSFMLSDGSTIIELGKHDSYTLTACAEKTTDKIFIKPQIIYLILLENATEENKENASEFSFSSLKTQLTKDYFEKDDVFNYILNKVADETAIKGDKNIFASSFYAGAKLTGGISDDVFTDTFIEKIRHYQSVYKNEDGKGYLKLDINHGIFQPKNGGIEADDYKGDLKINLCIATSEQIADQNEIKAIKTIEKKNGFASIPNDKALKEKKHLFFHIIPKTFPISEEAKTKWRQKQIPNNWFLLRTNESTGTAEVKNPLASDTYFNLCVNSENPDPSFYLGCENFGASKTKDGKIIFIERIRLQKDANSETMDVFVTLKGSNAQELKITAKP